MYAMPGYEEIDYAPFGAGTGQAVPLEDLDLGDDRARACIDARSGTAAPSPRRTVGRSRRTVDGDSAARFDQAPARAR